MIWENDLIAIFKLFEWDSSGMSTKSNKCLIEFMPSHQIERVKCNWPFGQAVIWLGIVISLTIYSNSLSQLISTWKWPIWFNQMKKNTQTLQLLDIYLSAIVQFTYDFVQPLKKIQQKHGVFHKNFNNFDLNDLCRCYFSLALNVWTSTISRCSVIIINRLGS